MYSTKKFERTKEKFFNVETQKGAENSSEVLSDESSALGQGLPDFSSQTIPKRGNIYQIY
jgi:hypothetical protein